MKNKRKTRTNDEEWQKKLDVIRLNDQKKCLKLYFLYPFQDPFYHN